MALLDELHRIVSLPNSEIKLWALESAYWLFERNLWLSLDEQAEAIAFLVTTSLNEREPKLRERYFHITGRLVASRPYTVGSHIDWQTLLEQLPHLSSSEVLSVLYLLRYANDEKHLAVLERYFDDFGKRTQAINSWVILAYTQRYTYDGQVWPYLHAVQKTINESFIDWRKRMQKKTGRADITAEERRVSAKERRAARSWTMERLRETQEQIRQQVQLQDRTAFIYTKAWNEQNPTYLPNQIQGWLALPETKDKIGRVSNLDWIFEQTLSIEIDEMAQGVKVLVEYALIGEERAVVGVERRLNSIIWDVVALAFQARRYVGAYLNWEKLTELLPQLQQEWKHVPASDLERVLSYFGYANDERFLGLLKTYLEHDLIRVRQVAVTAIRQLLCHLAYYCPEAILLVRQTYPELEKRISMPNTPEKWQAIREMLEALEQDVRPYFHYYSM